MSGGMDGCCRRCGSEGTRCDCPRSYTWEVTSLVEKKKTDVFKSLGEDEDPVWKVKDPDTGLFYLSKTYGWSVNSKVGTVFKRRRDLTASLREGKLADALRENPQLVVIKLIPRRIETTQLSEWDRKDV